MAATIIFSEVQALGVLRGFLASVLPAGIEIVLGQDNRVPEPRGDDFLTLTPLRRERTSTNVDAISVAGDVLTMLAPVLLTVQADVHGPNSPENAQIVSTTYRDDFAAEFFAASGLAVGPIHADDPRQVPFYDSEQQFETRWVVEIVMQLNQAVSVPTQTAVVVEVVPVSVDVEFPPR